MKTQVKKVVSNRAIKPKGFLMKIRSRHPSHDSIRGKIRMPFPSVVRFGSTTVMSEKVPNMVECNTPEAIQNSSSKLRMKNCFTNANVKTADWWIKNLTGNGFIQKIHNKNNHVVINNSEMPFPIVAKSHFGSRGKGNTLLHNLQELETFISTHSSTLNNYIFERFYNYNREYRLHVDSDGCFYTCRKMLKEDTPKDQRWFRNDSNSVWIVEENEKFDKPNSWNNIVADCVKALKAVGLDFGACDVRVQSTNEENGNRRKYCDYIVIEINSAPSFGEITKTKYLEQLPIILNKKYSSIKK